MIHDRLTNPPVTCKAIVEKLQFSFTSNKIVALRKVQIRVANNQLVLFW